MSLDDYPSLARVTIISAGDFTVMGVAHERRAMFCLVATRTCNNELSSAKR